MRRSLASLAAALLVLASAPDMALAAEEASGTNDRAEDEETADGEPSPEIFVPSEEISEDFAVSFPVDI